MESRYKESKIKVVKSNKLRRFSDFVGITKQIKKYINEETDNFHIEIGGF